MKQLGKLPPLYTFALNPYNNARFSSCPTCGQRTLLRKVPLLVHVQPLHPVILNKRCRYCPDCDVLIVHQDELEHCLAMAVREKTPDIIGNEYFVVGTLDKATWRKQLKKPIPINDLPAYIHGFKQYQQICRSASGWYHEDNETQPVDTPLSKDAISRIAQEKHPKSKRANPDPIELLIEKMEAHLPISAEIQRGTASYLQSKGISIPPHRNIQIIAVFNTGYEGDIMCTIAPTNSRAPVLTSLSHLKIPYRHPLEKEIRAYQKNRRKA